MSMYGNETDRPVVICGKSRTQQHLKDVFSPRRLIEKYGSKRLQEALNSTPLLYSDLPPVADYKEALDTISRGDEAFQSLPSKIRARFENDPVKMIEFLNDKNNRDEAVELGLISPAVANSVANNAKRDVRPDEDVEDVPITKNVKR